MTCAAGVDDGCDTGADAENIRVDAEGAESFHEMQMNVNQSRRDDMIFDIDHGSVVDFKIRTDRVNLTVAHANVEKAILPAGRIDETAAFEQEIGKLFVHGSIRSESSSPMEP